MNDIEQFLLFERLHEAALGTLSDRYEFEPAEGVLNNGWLERQSFILRRRESVHDRTS